MINLKNRSEQLEILDDFQENAESLKLVFDDINRVNRLLGGYSITIREIAKLIEIHSKENYTLIDLGCGDGDMLREIVRFCRQKKIKVKCIGIDLNEDALHLARKASLEFPEIEYVHQNILHLNTNDLNCDIIVTTLTMHHFTDTQLLIFLHKFIELASIGIIINDLQRSYWAYYLFKGFRRIFIKTKVAKTDGLISITRGFVKADLERYAKKLPSVSHSIQWKWAFRYVWVMQPNRLR
ncbi:MAG: methyltransferase domain-containing protein [Flavobacteriaceae bacterium]